MNKKLLAYIFCSGMILFSFAQPRISQRPPSAPAPEIKLGKSEKFTLENGLRVFVVENHKVPKVTIRLVLDYDPVREGNMAGKAEITGDLLKTGTATLTKSQIDKEIDIMGADLITYSTGVYASGLKRNTDKLAMLMADILMNAKFTQEEFDKIKKQYISNLASQKENPNAISGRVTDAVMYGENHPYGENMTEESINNITLADCEQFYKTYFRPNIGYLAIVGDITPAEAKMLINKVLGGWQKGEVPTAGYAEVMPPSERQVIMVDRPSSVQSVINITNPITLKPGSQWDIPSKVMNTILGGGASGRLFQNLREKHGYTYGAYSAVNADEIVGSFSASASVRNAVTDSAVMEFMSELNRIKNTEVAEEDLKRTLAFMSGSFARGLENPQTLANQAINIARYNLPEDYYTNYLKNLNAITAKDVQSAASQFVKPDNCYIVVVGNGQEVKEKLGQFAKIVRNFDIMGKEVVMEEAVVAPPPPPPPVMEEEVTISSDEVISRYTKAIGGGENLNKIKDVQITMVMEMQGQAITSINSFKYPNLSKKEVKMQDITLTTKVFDGAKGKEKTMEGITEITGKELEDLKVRSTMFLETRFNEIKLPFSVTKIEEVGERKAYVVVANLPSGEPVTYWYDKENGFKLKEQMRVPSPLGGMATLTTFFDDYKEVSGVKFPHKITQKVVDPVKGPQTLAFTVKEVKTNIGMKKKMFTVK